MDPMDKVTVEQRLAAIEAKLDAVLARLGPVEDGGAARVERAAHSAAVEFADVVELVRAGKLIQAIKVYRTRTGAGLREAKEVVDRIAGEQRARHGY
ncbi:ribosomal protein L7/L12 [Streptacidiphilus sp. MAP12-20]|uniref:hypothetical protein n=1 Tax=Streptacidiphilus sp. MAP12-20 TaxID=3156299 RepID=UPI003513CEA6